MNRNWSNSIKKKPDNAFLLIDHGHHSSPLQAARDRSRLLYKLENGEIDPLVWTFHFGNVPISKVPTCEDCKHSRRCPQNKRSNPIDCFSLKKRRQMAR